MIPFVTCLTHQHFRIIPRFPRGHRTHGVILPSLVFCPHLEYGYTLTCTIGTLCTQGTANRHACGQSEQCPDRLHDSDAHSWYRRASHTAALAPHTLHSEPPLPEEREEGIGQLRSDTEPARILFCRSQSIRTQAHTSTDRQGPCTHKVRIYFTGTE